MCAVVEIAVNHGFCPRGKRRILPEDFDANDWFGDLGLWNPEGPRERLEIVFASKAARYVRERAWPGFVAWHVEPDERQRLILEIRISKEVEQWFLGFGPDAEVIAPEWLREVMRERAAQMTKRHTRVGSDLPVEPHA